MLRNYTNLINLQLLYKVATQALNTYAAYGIQQYIS